MKKTSVSVEFIISSEEFSPDFISEKIELVPDEKGVKGELIDGRAIPHKVSFWKLGLEEKECDDILTAVEYIYNHIFLKRVLIRKLVDQYDCDSVLRIVLNIRGKNSPVVVLHDRYLTLFGSFRTRIDVDIYVL